MEFKLENECLGQAGDGEHAGKLLKEQLKYVKPGDTEENSNNFNYEDGGGVYPNLFDAHPPFQIDGNSGVVTGIGEMLLQSTETELILLPALPPYFSVGRVKGICARGRVWADFAFREGKLSEAVLYTDRSQVRTVVYQGKRQEPEERNEWEIQEFAYRCAKIVKEKFLIL